MMAGRFSNHAHGRRVALFGVALFGAGFICAGLFARSAHADAAETKKTFTQRCMACHTFGKGVKVGPDLKGVTQRRQRAWLLKFIRSSQSVIDGGDEIAVGLFEQFKQQRMPDWTDLSEAQIGSLLDWFGINGPEQQEPDARMAESATAAELEIGRQLFHGERRFNSGGSACASCHSIRDASRSSGGTLAFDLTDVYSEYQDGAMTQFLKHPCTYRMPESQSAAFLAPEESFALKAYLRHAALVNQLDRSGRMGAHVMVKTVDGTDYTDPVGSGSAVNTQVAPAANRVVWTRKVGAASRIARGSRLEDGLLFMVFPYAALLILFVGIGLRYVISRRQREAARAAASSAWKLFSGTTAWRIGLAATFALHLLGLLLPQSILAWNGVPLRLYLLEDSGFLLGALVLIGWVKIMRRHIARSTGSERPTLSDIADGALFSLFCIAIVSGLVIAVLYRWGSSWSASTLAPYMASLARGAPLPRLVEDMPFLVRIHALSWFAIIALVPFTSAALIAFSVIDRGVALAVLPINAGTRFARSLLVKLIPARWLWPEEDVNDARARWLWPEEGVDNARTRWMWPEEDVIELGDKVNRAKGPG